MFSYRSGMPYERVTRGPRYAIRVEDLQATDALEVWCLHCGRRGLVAPHRLHERFRGYERLVHVASMMICRGCRRRAGLEWAIVQARPPG